MLFQRSEWPQAALDATKQDISRMPQGHMPITLAARVMKIALANPEAGIFERITRKPSGRQLDEVGATAEALHEKYGIPVKYRKNRLYLRSPSKNFMDRHGISAQLGGAAMRVINTAALVSQDVSPVWGKMSPKDARDAATILDGQFANPDAHPWVIGISRFMTDANQALRSRHVQKMSADYRATLPESVGRHNAQPSHPGYEALRFIGEMGTDPTEHQIYLGALAHATLGSYHGSMLRENVANTLANRA